MWLKFGYNVDENLRLLRPCFTTKCYFIVLLQVNEISLTVNQFHKPLIFLLTVNNYY